MRRMWSTALFLAVVLGLGTSAPAAESSQERRLRLLEEQLKRTQDEVNQLRRELQQQKAISTATQQQTEKAADAAAEAKTKTAKLPGWLDSVTPFGDVRYRHEGFYNQPRLANQDVTANNRERIRARVGIRANFGDEVGATVRIASGNINDPISTNQTLTGNFTPFSVNLDWAYLTLTPGKTFNIRPGLFTLNAGKFPNPLFRVGELVWDDDLSPEGLNQTIAVLEKPIGDPKGVSLDQVKLNAEEWTFSQINNRQDGWMFGGQVNPSMHIGDIQLEGGVGQYGWLNPDQIAQATSRNTTAFTASGAPVANPNFNSSLFNTNQIVVQRIQPPQVPGKAKPAPFAATTGFVSDFNMTNVTLQTTIPNFVQAQPIKFFLDYVHNWGAAGGKDTGWQGGVQIGQTKVRGDWSVMALYEWIQQDAVISAFNWSDFGLGGTNAQGPVIALSYQLLNPLTLTARSYFTQFIDKPWVASQGTSNFVNNPELYRLQLDAILRF